MPSNRQIGTASSIKATLLNDILKQLIRLGQVIYASGVSALGAQTFTGKKTFASEGATAAQFNLPVSIAPTTPVDGDVWRQDNTNTGLKIRVNGVTKTISLV